MRIFYITNTLRNELYWGIVGTMSQTDFINRLNSTYHRAFRACDVPKPINVNGQNDIRHLANTGARIFQVI